MYIYAGGAAYIIKLIEDITSPRGRNGESKKGVQPLKAVAVRRGLLSEMADTNFHIHAHRCGVVLNGFLFAGNSFLKTSLCVISRVCPFFFIFFTINPRGPFNPISLTLSLTNEILLLNCCSLTRILSCPRSYIPPDAYIYIIIIVLSS